MSHHYVIDPKAPLVFRSGKPFGAGQAADPSLFPMPSSAAGLMRTLHADQRCMDFGEQKEALTTLACRGPYLTRRDAKGQLAVMLPKPADAIYMKAPDGQPQLMRISPHGLKEGSGSDLPSGLLHLVMEGKMKGKPCTGTAFWSLNDFIAWSEGSNLSYDTINKNGCDLPPVEYRTHVGIDPETLGPSEGRLFQTAGMDCGAQRKVSGWDMTESVMTVVSDADLRPTLAAFGGERRLSSVSRLAKPLLPDCPEGLPASLGKSRGIRLTLMTPGIFSGGYAPGWIDPVTLRGSLPVVPSVQLRLMAVAVDRWMPVSGWDLQSKKPKAMRKAVPAGSVYWFAVEEGSASDLASLWFTTVGDNAQDNIDGFSQVSVAPWSPVSH